MDSDDIKGPVILWLDYGYEGWAPSSHATLKDALAEDRFGHRFVITRVVDFDVTETEAV